MSHTPQLARSEAPLQRYDLRVDLVHSAVRFAALVCGIVVAVAR